MPPVNGSPREMRSSSVEMAGEKEGVWASGKRWWGDERSMALSSEVRRDETVAESSVVGVGSMSGVG